MIFKNRKILNIIIISVVLAACFFLLYRLRILYDSTENAKSAMFCYIIILVIIILNIYLLINALSTGKIIVAEEKTEEKKTEETQQKDKDKKSKTETEEEKLEEAKKINVKEIVQKILPPKTSKLSEYCEQLIINAAHELELVQGICHVKNLEENKFSSVAFYAYYADKKPEDFVEGETIPGQVAKDKEIKFITNVPEDHMSVLSGLGKSVPSVLIFVPVVHDDISIAVLELASFKQPDEVQVNILNELQNKVANIIFNFIKVPEKTKNDKK